MEFLNLLWGLVCSTFTSLVGVLESITSFVWGILTVLHMDYPRLEGLIIGISLAWLLSRSDKHPLLRAASSPLKLIIDILDLAWDQTVEFLSDIFGTAKGWLKGSFSWCKLRITSAWNWCIGGLKSVRGKLKKEVTEDKKS